jgi:hypothetical protein
MDIFKKANAKMQGAYRFGKKYYTKGANRGLRNDKLYSRRYARRKIKIIDKEIEG